MTAKSEYAQSMQARPAPKFRGVALHKRQLLYRTCEPLLGQTFRVVMADPLPVYHPELAGLCAALGFVARPKKSLFLCAIEGPFFDMESAYLYTMPATHLEWFLLPLRGSGGEA